MSDPVTYPKAISTYKTYLYKGSSKLVDIKSTPNLGGSPEMLETTTLSDGIQTFIPGIQTLDSGGLEFTANYKKDDFDTLKGYEGTEYAYSVRMGDSGENGIFYFNGILSVFPNGGGVNEVVEMTISIAPTSIISTTAPLNG